MLAQIKRHVPQPIKRALSLIYQRTVGNWQKQRLIFKMETKHKELLFKIKGKKKIRVVFLAIHKSVWKVDALFQKMISDPFFEPIILVCPYTVQGEERLWIDLYECFDYFKNKKYSTHLSYKKEEKRWIKLDELKPDIVFFTNPNNLTLDEYYRNAFENYLTCYVPYFSDIATSYDLQSAYNQLFHNLIWKNFADSTYSKERAKSVLANKGRNIEVTGSPFLEGFFTEKKSDFIFWKTQERPKKKIIYAPHQSIFKDGVINLSTFIETGEFIKNISEKYQDEVQWSFKPHTLLKSNLYKHPEWGKTKTDAYYKYWESSSYTQLDESDYIDLFKASDSILHDCGSFILDYLFTQNPCGYLELNPANQLRAINSFGLDALNCYERIHSLDEIEDFVRKVARGAVIKNQHYAVFFEKNISTLYADKKPSILIIEKIKGYLM